MARARNILTSLAKLFSASTQPIYLLDAQRQIIYCNPACEVWLQLSAEELVGQRCDYHSIAQPNLTSEIAAALCPPPYVLEGQSRNGKTLVHKKDGSVSRRDIHFTPLRSEAKSLLGVIAVVSVNDENEATYDALRLPAESAESLHSQIQELRATFQRRFHLDRLVGTSLSAVRLRQQVEFAISGHGRTLVVGPVGSGRQHVACVIHHGRNLGISAPLLPLDCRLLAPKQTRSTIESFLQQHRSTDREGNITLLLLNADNLAADVQDELTGVCGQPPGLMQILTTAQRPLMTLAEEGNFSPELASFLSTFTIELPPLASRSEDIAPLAQVLLEEVNSTNGRQLGGFTPDALRILALYPWPRHLAELTEIVQEACGRATGIMVEASDLPPQLQMAASVSAHPRRQDPPIEIDVFLAEIERELLQRALVQSKGNKAKAAKLLGMNRARLLRRLSQLGLE